MTGKQRALARPPLIGVALPTIALLATLAGCAEERPQPTHAIAPTVRHEQSINAAVGDIVKAAQEKALARVQGGEAGMLIPWNEPKLDLQGTLTWDKAVTMTYSCRRYRQSLFLGTEVLTGALTACPQADGGWKIVKTPS